MAKRPKLPSAVLSAQRIYKDAQANPSSYNLDSARAAYEWALQAHGINADGTPAETQAQEATKNPEDNGGHLVNQVEQEQAGKAERKRKIEQALAKHQSEDAAQSPADFSSLEVPLMSRDVHEAILRDQEVPAEAFDYQSHVDALTTQVQATSPAHVDLVPAATSPVPMPQLQRPARDYGQGLTLPIALIASFISNVVIIPVSFLVLYFFLAAALTGILGSGNNIGLNVLLFIGGYALCISFALAGIQYWVSFLLGKTRTGFWAMYAITLTAMIISSALSFFVHPSLGLSGFALAAIGMRLVWPPVRGRT